MGINIYLRDYKLSASGWEKALTRHFNVVDSKGDNETIPETDDQQVVFLHPSVSSIEDKFKVWAAARPTHYVVLISSAVRVPHTKTNSKSRVYGCFWSAAEVKQCSIKEVRRLVEGLKSGACDWSLFQPAPTENLWAMRLLCEAWLLKKNWPENLSCAAMGKLKQALQIGGAKPNLPDGIALTPPDSREEWLASFAEGTGGDAVESILNELPTEETKSAVRSFFSEMDKAQPDFEQVANLFLVLDGVVKSQS